MEFTSGVRPFQCAIIDKAIIRMEWEKWLRSMTLYLESENIDNPGRKRSKLLHFGGPQLQEVVYKIPGAIIEINETNDVFAILISKLNEYFSPQQKSTFERHLFRSLKRNDPETLNQFLIRIRQQVNRCSFGNTVQETIDINLKDKLIDFWAPTELKKKLLEKERSLEEVVELCRVHEQIIGQTKLMGELENQPGSSTDSLNRITTATTSNNTIECFRCGKLGHRSNDPNCIARKTKCNRCGLIGHFAIKCKTKSRKRGPDTNQERTAKRRGNIINFVDLEEEKENNDYISGNGKLLPDFNCFKINSQLVATQTGDEVIKCYIGSVEVTMLIDSGSTVNVLNEKDWMSLKTNNAVMWDVTTKLPKGLKPYASNTLEIEHSFQSTIAISQKQEHITTFYVILEGDVSLLGRDTAKRLGILKLGLEINRLGEVNPFPKIKNIKVKLSIDPTVKPVQQPFRRIPIAIETQVEAKLQEALSKDIIEKVENFSEWISPIVVAFKPSGDIRICVDMRRANVAIRRENYPIPTFESFMIKLRHAHYFSRLDLLNAYHQIELDEGSRGITTFITHRGMFRYKRLMFGVNSAPEIFQRIFEGILAPCQNCLNYLDDVIVFGGTAQEHDNHLKVVRQTLKENGVLLNEQKCVIKVQQLEFFGHTLSEKGIMPSKDKVVTVQHFRAPKTKEELRSFLGLIIYLGKFIPDLGTTTAPLRELMKHNIPFEWTSQHQRCFELLKESLAKIPMLSYFDPKRRTRLIADASPVALGAVLLQFEEPDVPKVISFASKTLSNVEKRYSQTEKESLALVWGVERFYFYFAGIFFELVTDHKPLETIFKCSSRPPARIERWVLRLQSFQYKVIYQAGKFNIADSLSRLCQLNDRTGSFDIDNELHIRLVVETSIPKALKLSQLFAESRSDGEITEVRGNVDTGNWEGENQNPFYPFRFELTTMGPILLRGNRIVIPKSLRKQVMELAHEGHPGGTVMKRRLRSKVWWPLIDRDAEKHVKSCQDCLLVSQPNRPTPFMRHKFPERPWEFIAMDLIKTLPIPGEILVIIDYYSRYFEIKFLSSTTSTNIIAQLNEIFCRLGIPKSIRTDNGPQFTSQQFQDYCETNNIKLVHTPPYWPQANGEVENMNRSILKRLQISHNKGPDYKSDLQKFVFMYNVTPHSSTGKSSTELLYGRNIQDKIPSIKDPTALQEDEGARDSDMVNKEKGKQKEESRRKVKEHDFRVGDKVLMKNVIVPNKLTTTFNKKQYEILEIKGNEVILENEGQIVRRHASHLKKIPVINDKSTLEQGTEESPDTNEDKEPPSVIPQQVEPLRLKKDGEMWRPVVGNN